MQFLSLRKMNQQNVMVDASNYRIPSFPSHPSSMASGPWLCLLKPCLFQKTVCKQSKFVICNRKHQPTRRRETLLTEKDAVKQAQNPQSTAAEREVHSAAGKVWKKRPRMSFLEVLLCVLVLASPVLGATSQPNCSGVVDFEACLGNTNEFCPKNISCLCKNGEPFCRCDYYRMGWMEYWYMGPKCNHLWNTLDFILVATLPGVALVFIVVVIFSAVFCLKTRKAGKQPKAPHSGAQQNPAFSTDTAASPGHGHHQPAEDNHYTQDAWVGQIPKVTLKREDFNDVSIPNQRQDYSPVYGQALRTADQESDYLPQSRAQREEFDYPRRNLPYPVYPEARQYRRY